MTVLMYLAEAGVAGGMFLIIGFITRWAWDTRKER